MPAPPLPLRLPVPLPLLCSPPGGGGRRSGRLLPGVDHSAALRFHTPCRDGQKYRLNVIYYGCAMFFIRGGRGRSVILCHPPLISPVITLMTIRDPDERGGRGGGLDLAKLGRRSREATLQTDCYVETDLYGYIWGVFLEKKKRRKKNLHPYCPGGLKVPGAAHWSC